MRIIKDKILLKELKKVSAAGFGKLVKAVVDIEKEIMAVDAELHADQEALLLKKGSNQQNLWGINLYPDKEVENWIEFDSMINLRPSQGNLSRGVDDPKVRKKIIIIVNKLVKR